MGEMCFSSWICSRNKWKTYEENKRTILTGQTQMGQGINIE